MEDAAWLEHPPTLIHRVDAVMEVLYKVLSDDVVDGVIVPRPPLFEVGDYINAVICLHIDIDEARLGMLVAPQIKGDLVGRLDGRFIWHTILPSCVAELDGGHPHSFEGVLSPLLARMAGPTWP